MYRFAFGRKWKSKHTWENLDGQKLLGVSVSGLYFLNATYQMLKYFINLDSIKIRFDQQENWQGMKKANQTDYNTYIYSIIYIYNCIYGTAVMKKLSYLLPYIHVSVAFFRG